MKKETFSRLSYWDNVKGFLIVLVVLGHLLERMPLGNTLAGYKLIYLFHMPLFVFCSGYLASSSTKNIVKKILIPYVVCQLVYCVFSMQVIQATTPVWILWYLLALAFWRLTTPLLDKVGAWWRIPLILAAIVISCLFGFDDSVGYFVSISRIIVFYPYFMAGFFIKKYDREKGETDFLRLLRRKSVRITAFVVLAVFCVVFVLVSPTVDSEWLYGSFSYNNGKYNVFFRVFHYVMAIAMGIPVLVLVPRRETFLSSWGKNSLIIYLTHIAAVGAMSLVFTYTDIHMLVGYALCIAVSVLFCVLVTWVMGIINRILSKKKAP